MMLSSKLTFILRIQARYTQLRHSSGALNSFQVIYKEHGDPNKVLESETTTLPPVKPGQVAVKLLAAPVNPSDINMIQGVYPIKPPLPAVGGNEGVGEVMEVGSGVNAVKPGDWVVPGFSGWGTWRTFAVCPESDLMRVPNDIPVLCAATLGVNPCTAYRMLHDFVQLKKGDVVIQNGGNSGVGQAVIQIAAYLGLQTVNIVRNRPNFEELEGALKDFGATYVVSDEFVRTPDMKSLMKSIPKPKLAFNCVGGKSSSELLKYMDRKGIMVTYGGMSKMPMMVPAGPLIFSDVTLIGYWMTQWNKEHANDPERFNMWRVLSAMVQQDVLKLPLYEEKNIRDFKSAISRSMESFVSRKQILIMDN